MSLKKTAYISSLIFLFLLSGCKEKIDSTSKDSLIASEEKVKSELTPEKQKEFEESYMIVINKYTGLEKTFIYKLQNNDGKLSEIQIALNKHLNGKTADDIINEANKIKEQMNKEKLAEDKILKTKDEEVLKKEQETLNANIIAAQKNIQEIQPQLDKLLEDKKVIDDKISPLASVEIKDISLQEIKNGDYEITYTIVNGTDFVFNKYIGTLTLMTPEQEISYELYSSLGKDYLDNSQGVQQTQIIKKEEIANFKHKETILPEIKIHKVINTKSGKFLATSSNDSGLDFIDEVDIKTLQLKLKYTQKKLEEYKK